MLIEGPASRQARSRPDVCGVSACGPGGPDGSQQGHRASPDSPRGRRHGSMRAATPLGGGGGTLVVPVAGDVPVAAW